MNLAQIREESKESLDSHEAYVPGTLYNEKQQDIKELGMMSGFVPQDNYFII